MVSFENARLLAYDRTSQYFGENYLYAVQQHLIIDGSIYNLNNQSGVSAVWSGVIGFVESATDYDSIVINGTNFGAGRINSINFTEGNDVRKKDYTIDITIFSKGDLPSEINSILSNIHLAESFNESFDFSIGEDRNYNYKHSVTIKYIKGEVITNPIDSAKSLAAVLFSSPPIYGFIDNQQSQFYNGVGKHTYTESYNKITNECSFTKNFVQGTLTGGSVIKLTQEINTNEDGVSSVSERGRIEDVLDFSGGIDFSAAYARASSLLTAYDSGPALRSQYVSFEKTINRFDRTIDYIVRYSNDPKIQDTYIWDYTKDIDRGEGCYYTVKESGTIKGLAALCVDLNNAKYNAALNAWNSIVQPGIANRISAYYNFITGLNNALKKLSSNEKRSVFSGQISYDYSYTDDLTITDNIIKKVEVQITDSPLTPAYNRFAVAGVGEIVQNLGITKEGRRSVSVRLLGKRRTALSVYLREALSRANLAKPEGNNLFISACNYSFTPSENTFNLQIEWTYFGTAPAGVLV